MTSNQHNWVRKNKGSELDYVAYLEDALMKACEKISDGKQSYEEANSPRGWFDTLLSVAEIHEKTGESPLFLKYG